MPDEKDDAGDKATREMAASRGFVMEAETAALVRPPSLLRSIVIGILGGRKYTDGCMDES